MKNSRKIFIFRRTILIVVCSAFSANAPAANAQEGNAKLITGKAAMGDWTSDAPGVRREITVEDLPAPSSNLLAINPPHVVERLADAQLRAPPGFKIDMYASGFRDPRFLLTAPNGDILSRVTPIRSKCRAIQKTSANRTSPRYLRNAI